MIYLIKQEGLIQNKVNSSLVSTYNCKVEQNWMQSWHYGKGLIYYRLIFRLTKLAFLRAWAIPRENVF